MDLSRFRRGKDERPRIFGHRGASRLDPENTLKAFERAGHDGADGVELDVRLCRTGELVVFHDEDLKRLTGDPGKIHERSLGELREKRIGTEPIPTLDEVLDWAADKVLLNIEIKSDGGPRATAIALAERLRARGIERAENLLVSSFHPLALGAFIGRSAAPTALLYHAKQALALRRAWAAPWLGVDALHPDRRIALGKSARQIQALRMRYVVNVWTVDDPAEVSRLSALGVDGIITNDPAAIRRGS